MQDAFKGVFCLSNVRPPTVFGAAFSGGVRTKLGRFCTAEEAARAYDDAVRKAGRRVVNFPRPRTDEVQAVRGEEERVTLLRHAGKRVLRTGPLPPAPDYKGVAFDVRRQTATVFASRIRVGGVLKCLGRFCTAEEAARAYDDAARNAGRSIVNFPRPGTDEVRAVKGEKEEVTLARHTAAQHAAGGAGAAGTVAPSDMASSPSKRRAAAPPPSEPPRKRVPLRGVKSPDAVKPNAPAAPLPPPYKRRPPHRIERESSLPPGFVAPISGIKTETPPAAVKAETPAAPPMPAAAASGWSSPAPPSASAAAAPPVKVEH